MRLKLLYGWILVMIGIQMIDAQTKKDFFLYLLPETVDARQLSRLDVKTIKPPGKPFLTTVDVRSYLKDTNDLMLDYEATDRLKKLKVPVSGRPFIVFAGNEPVYTGAFWMGFSSLTFRGVAIDVSELKGDFATIRLDLDYPPLAPKNIAFDPRPDPRIFRIFEDHGVLFEEVWLYGKCRSIHATGKRRQSYVFTFDVISAAKAAYDLPQVTFEIFDDEERSLRAAIEAKSDRDGNRRFNSQTEILLKFERQTNAKDPADLIWRGFEPK